jgi:hypothetical protein
MSLQDCKAVYGLSGVGTNTRTNVSGSATVGIGQTSMQFPDANEGYSIRMIFAAAADEATLNPFEGDTTGTDAFTAGTAQVETATVVAASGATSNGNLALVVTAAGMTGSPLTVNVALTTTAHTTAALIAEACRTTLAANTAVAALFTVGGSTTAITLTRKPTSTFTVPGGTLNLYPANDATLNILIPTALGVTGAASSTNTTAGVASAGVKVYDNGVNFEGNSLTTIVTINGILAKCATGAVSFTDADLYVGVVESGAIDLRAVVSISLSVANPITFTASDPSDITITVIGQTA